MLSNKTDEEVSDIGELLDQFCNQATSAGRNIIPSDLRSVRLTKGEWGYCPLVAAFQSGLASHTFLSVEEYWSFAAGFDGKEKEVGLPRFIHDEAKSPYEFEFRFYELGKAFREKALSENWEKRIE